MLSEADAFRFGAIGLGGCEACFRLHGEGLRRLGGCVFVLREKRGGADCEGEDELGCAHELL